MNFLLTTLIISAVIAVVGMVFNIPPFNWEIW
jgi:hypothetical protein